jgi:hypothetical protein
MKTAIAQRHTKIRLSPPPPILTSPVDAGAWGPAAGKNTLFLDKYASENILSKTALMPPAGDSQTAGTSCVMQRKWPANFGCNNWRVF